MFVCFPSCVVVLWQLPRYLGLGGSLPATDSDFGVGTIWSVEASDPVASPHGSLCYAAGRVWLVLSRSWPSTHFLPGGPCDSRVKFIRYPRISATWKCQVSENRLSGLWYSGFCCDLVPSIYAPSPSGQSTPPTHCTRALARMHVLPMI